MLLDVNLTGAFLVAKAVAKTMIADPAASGKKIVLVSSMAGVSDPIREEPATAPPSTGVLGLMKSMARELAPYKINVNAINPGGFRHQLPRREPDEAGQGPGITVEEYIKNPAWPGRPARPDRLPSRWAGWGRPRTSPTSCRSSCPTGRATSPEKTSICPAARAELGRLGSADSSPAEEGAF